MKGKQVYLTVLFCFLLLSSRTFSSLCLCFFYMWFLLIGQQVLTRGHICNDVFLKILGKPRVPFWVTKSTSVNLLLNSMCVCVCVPHFLILYFLFHWCLAQSQCKLLFGWMTEWYYLRFLLALVICIANHSIGLVFEHKLKI